MKAVGIKMLKDRLSEYVRLAAAGETVLVLDREQVVAELNPPAEGRRPHLAEGWKADLIRQGILTPPATKETYVPRDTGHKRYPLEEILRDLDDARADRV